MRGAAVVPEQEIAEPPDVLVDEFLLLGVVEHGVEKLLGFVLRDAFDAHAHQAIDIDGLAVGVFIGAEHRMLARAERFGALAVALLGRAVVVVVDGEAAFEPVADLWIERLVGGVAAREQGVAASRRNLDGVQQRCLVRHLRMDHVVVEHHLAVGQGADRLAVLADVRDQHDAGQDLRIAFREEFWWPARHALFAEIAGDADQILLRQLLLREDDDDVVEPRLVDRLNGGLVRLLTQIEAADLRADVFGEGNDVELGLRDHGHGYSPLPGFSVRIRPSLEWRINNHARARAAIRDLV
jgi:hypothetical protein